MRQAFRWFALVSCLVVLTWSTAALSANGEEGAPGGALGELSPRGAGNPVLHWNTIALEVFPVDPGLVLDSRAFAILHAAVHDAVNGVERRYRSYTVTLSSPGASIDAAVASASHDVLAALSPSQQSKIESEYTMALSL